jgi:hypothetical protein
MMMRTAHWTYFFEPGQRVRSSSGCNESTLEFQLLKAVDTSCEKMSDCRYLRAARTFPVSFRGEFPQDDLDRQETAIRARRGTVTASNT